MPETQALDRQPNPSMLALGRHSRASLVSAGPEPEAQSAQGSGLHWHLTIAPSLTEIISAEVDYGMGLNVTNTILGSIAKYSGS